MFCDLSRAITEVLEANPKCIENKTSYTHVEKAVRLYNITKTVKISVHVKKFIKETRNTICNLETFLKNKEVEIKNTLITAISKYIDLGPNDFINKKIYYNNCQFEQIEDFDQDTMDSYGLGDDHPISTLKALVYSITMKRKKDKRLEDILINFLERVQIQMKKDRKMLSGHAYLLTGLLLQKDYKNASKKGLDPNILIKKPNAKLLGPFENDDITHYEHHLTSIKNRDPYDSTIIKIYGEPLSIDQKIYTILTVSFGCVYATDLVNLPKNKLKKFKTYFGYYYLENINASKYDICRSIGRHFSDVRLGCGTWRVIENYTRKLGKRKYKKLKRDGRITQKIIDKCNGSEIYPIFPDDEIFADLIMKSGGMWGYSPNVGEYFLRIEYPSV